MCDLSAKTCSLLLVEALFFVGILAVSVSPLYYATGIDSYIFQNIGQAIDQGKIPYIDIFDDKGPLLLYLNYWGQLIGGKSGLFVLLVLNLFSSLLIWHSICSLFALSKSSYWILLLSLVAMMRFYIEGNNSEEWSLPFISLPILFYITCWVKRDYSITRRKAFIIGCCLSSIVLLRANNIAPILGFLFCWVYVLLKNHDFSNLSRGIGYAFIGILVPIAIFCFHFYCLAGWMGVYEMFYGTILFNFEYFFKYNASSEASVWQRFVFMLPALLITSFVIINSRKKDRLLIVPVLISIFITLLTTGKNLFLHYHLILIPLFVVCFIWMQSRKCIMSLSMLTLFFMRMSLVSAHCSYTMYRDTEINKEYCEEFLSIMNHIPQNDQNSIWNYNAYFSLDAMCFANFVPMNKFYLGIGVNVSERFREEEKNVITKIVPHWIIIEEGNLNGTPEEISFINSNYTQIFKTHSKYRTNVCFWKYNQKRDIL